MSISSRIYTEFSNNLNKFDINEFIISIVLFDEVLISNPSVIPNLIKSITIDGLLKLIEKGYISVVGGGPSAQANFDYRNPGFFSNKPIHSPLRFGFETIYVDHTSPQNLSVEDRLLHNIKNHNLEILINNNDARTLVKAFTPTLKVISGEDLNYGAEIHKDVRDKQEFITNLLKVRIAKEHQIPTLTLQLDINVEAIAENTFQIQTNLGKLLSKTDEEIHEIFKRPFFDITGTNLQLLRMKSVEAIAGLTNTQSEIVSSRVDYLSKLIKENELSRQFTRIQHLTNTPIISADSEVNIDELIYLKESSEAYAFRSWLRGSDKYTDQEIIEITSNWRKKLGELLSTSKIRNLKWLASTGSGVLLGDAANNTLSGIDLFLDRLFPRMGPIGFINEYNRFMKKQDS